MKIRSIIIQHPTNLRQTRIGLYISLSLMVFMLISSIYLLYFIPDLNGLPSFTGKAEIIKVHQGGYGPGNDPYIVFSINGEKFRYGSCKTSLIKAIENSPAITVYADEPGGLYDYRKTYRITGHVGEIVSYQNVVDTRKKYGYVSFFLFFLFILSSVYFNRWRKKLSSR